MYQQDKLSKEKQLDVLGSCIVSWISCNLPETKEKKLGSCMKNFQVNLFCIKFTKKSGIYNHFLGLLFCVSPE